MEWHEQKTTKKGDVGEEIVRNYLLSKGYVPYVPIAEKAHPFDNLCASQDKKHIFIAEVKTKEARKYYPDTGIDIRHYKEYKFISNKYSIPVWLFFVDATNKKIYGNKLKKLEEPTVSNGKSYPLEQKGIIYFPLELMKTIALLSDESCAKIKMYNTKNYEGAWVYSAKEEA